MFDCKNIKDPYRFIEDLHARLEGAIADNEAALSSSYYPMDFNINRKELYVLESIMKFVENYSSIESMCENCSHGENNFCNTERVACDVWSDGKGVSTHDKDYHCDRWEGVE